MQTQPTVPEPVVPKPARDPIVIEAIEKMGGCTAAAAKLTAWARAKKLPQKIGKTAISNWERIPDRWVRGVHELTGFALKRLRADLYDPTFEGTDVTA